MQSAGRASIEEKMPNASPYLCGLVGRNRHCIEKTCVGNLKARCRRRIYPVDLQISTWATFRGRGQPDTVCTDVSWVVHYFIAPKTPFATAFNADDIVASQVWWY